MLTKKQQITTEEQYCISFAKANISKLFNIFVRNRELIETKKINTVTHQQNLLMIKDILKFQII